MKNGKRLFAVLLSLLTATCIVGLCACQKTDDADRSQTASSFNSVISVPTGNSQSANASASQGASYDDSSINHSDETSVNGSESTPEAYYDSQGGQSASQSDGQCGESENISTSEQTSQDDESAQISVSDSDKIDSATDSQSEQSASVSVDERYTPWIK